MARFQTLKSRRTPSSLSLPSSLLLVGGVGDGVHVGYVESGALDGDLRIVDLGAVCGVEGVDLATIGGVHLVQVLNPAEASEVAVVVEVLIGVGERNCGRSARGYIGDDLRGSGTEVVAGEAVVVLAELLALAGGAQLRADPEGVVVAEEDLGVGAIGDGDGCARGHGGEVEQGEPACVETVGLELLTGYI